MNIKMFLQHNSKKLHPIDMAFMGIALLSLIIFYFVFKRDVKFITIRVKVADNATVLQAFHSPSDEFMTGFIVGDTEKDELGRVVSKIVNVESYKTQPNQQVIYVDINTKVTYNPNRGVYSAQGKDVVFGESFTFSFSKVHFKGIVVDLPGLSSALHIKVTKTIVRAQVRYENRQFSDIYGVPSYMAGAFKVGDTVVDTRGNVLAKILELTTVPAKRVVFTSEGQPVEVSDPELKDMYLVIELVTKEVNGKIYMFDYLPVLIGETIPIYTQRADILPTITEIVK